LANKFQLFIPARTLMLLLIWAGLALVLAACVSSGLRAQPTQTRSITLERCPPQSINRLLPGRSECGTHIVYEDRSAARGRTIELNIVLLPAVSRSPEPDPVFFLAGGPGQSAADSFPLLYPVFQQINQRRDIVLVDQRGTGKSNPLECRNGGEDLQHDEDIEAWIESCLAGLEADPALYTTTIAMQDLDEVRSALGYSEVNLYGVSYGTRAALTYLQMYPDKVRSVILDGVVPQQQALGENAARDAQRSLDLIFTRCGEDPECSRAFPNLSVAFQNLLENLDEQPVEVTLPHPSKGGMVTLNFTKEMMTGAVRFLSYAPETSALLPLLIYTSNIEENYTLLAAQYLILSDQLVSGIAEGANYSVLCAEDEPFFTAEKVSSANAGTYLGNQQTDMLNRICEIWPRGQAPGWFKDPVVSDVPALLLSGELDPVTPPENAEEVAQGLTNSLHLVAKGQGHNIVYRGCIPNLVNTFLDSASSGALNSQCVDVLQGAQFFVNFTGPTP
jgi:pimeloyl-ACP methyl ester carboxylesterase